MESLPIEIFLKITSLLKPRDLRKLRTLSSALKKKVDTLYENFSCLVINEKRAGFFIGSQKPKIIPTFTRMRIESVTFLQDPSKRVRLQRDYFKNIVELELAAYIAQPHFLQIIKVCKTLRILRLNSALLGGSNNIFGIHSRANNDFINPASLLFIRRALPKPLLAEIKQEGCPKISKSRKWSRMEELHITIDYISPSTSNFWPAHLVENLYSLQFLPATKLKVFTISVESSKDNEIFFFTMNSLLQTIPKLAYSSLKCVNIQAEKCRPSSQLEDAGSHHQNDFSRMQLSELTVNILKFNRYSTPSNLTAILTTQNSLKHVLLQGVNFGNHVS